MIAMLGRPYRFNVDGIRLEGDDARKAARLVKETIYGNTWQRSLLSLLALIVTSCILSGLFVYLGILTARALFGHPPLYVIVGLGIAAGSCMGTAWNRFWMRKRRRALRRGMARLGYELCLECGYWLRGLPDDATKCPECGAPRKGQTRDTAR